MYVGDVGPERLQHLIDELVSNAIDQFLRGQCQRVDVRIDDDGWIEVADDGPGLPFDIVAPESRESLATQYLTNPHFSATADGAAPHAHIHRLRGAGLAVVNAASRTFLCRSWRSGTCWEQHFVCGEPQAEPCRVDSVDGRGTTFRMLPDAEVLGVSRVDRSLLRATLWRTAHLFPGFAVGCDPELFVAPSGLGDYLRAIYEPTDNQRYAWRDRAMFRWYGQRDEYAIDAAAFGFAPASGPACQWRSWVNGRGTPLHGSHVNGFALALKDVGWRPAMAMLHVIVHDPRYAGPTRDKYVSHAARNAIRTALQPPLLRYTDENDIGLRARGAP